MLHACHLVFAPPAPRGSRPLSVSGFAAARILRGWAMQPAHRLGQRSPGSLHLYWPASPHQLSFRCPFPYVLRPIGVSPFPMCARMMRTSAESMGRRTPAVLATAAGSTTPPSTGMDIVWAHSLSGRPAPWGWGCSGQGHKPTQNQQSTGLSECIPGL